MTFLRWFAYQLGLRGPRVIGLPEAAMRLYPSRRERIEFAGRKAPQLPNQERGARC